MRHYERFLYTYDFGDYWQHELRLEKILEPEPKKIYPLCIGGKGACPPEMNNDLVYSVLDAIEAPYERRTQRAMRQALKAHDDPAECAREVIRVAEELGLEPPAPVEPLPAIEEEDIHLVTWVALAPTEAKYEEK